MRSIIVAILTLVLSCSGDKGGESRSQADASTATSITIASWNLKNFGLTKLNDPARISVIVDILKQYDITAIQEIQNADQTLAPTLIGMMNTGGDNYNYVISDRVGHTRQEQYLYIYNDDLIDAISGTGGYGHEPNNEFSREPYYHMFRVGSFDFYLMSIHTDPDEVSIEVPALEMAFTYLQNGTANEHDIILLGDFNAKAPGVSAGSYAIMDDLATISNMLFTINDETNTRGGRAYDNILFQSNYTTEYMGEAGVSIFWVSFGLTEDEGFTISDHKPVWAKFVVSGTDDD